MKTARKQIVAIIALTLTLGISWSGFAYAFPMVTKGVEPPIQRPSMPIGGHQFTIPWDRIGVQTYAYLDRDPWGTVSAGNAGIAVNPATIRVNLVLQQGLLQQAQDRWYYPSSIGGARAD